MKCALSNFQSNLDHILEDMDDQSEQGTGTPLTNGGVDSDDVGIVSRQLSSESTVPFFRLHSETHTDEAGRQATKL